MAVGEMLTVVTFGVLLLAVKAAGLLGIVYVGARLAIRHERQRSGGAS
jgi:hypothetical protein